MTKPRMPTRRQFGIFDFCRHSSFGLRHSSCQPIHCHDNTTTLPVAVADCHRLRVGDEPRSRKRPAKPPPLAEQGPRPKPVPTPSAAEIDASIKRGIEFLLTHQNKNGSWGSADINRPGEIYAPVPGSHQAFRAAVTAMDISALIETDEDDPRVVKALDRAEAWLFENLPHVRRATPDCFYNVWTHAYSPASPGEDAGPQAGRRRAREKNPRADSPADSTCWTATKSSMAAGRITISDYQHEETRRLLDQFRHRRGAGGHEGSPRRPARIRRKN